jgi:hypothetical protein
MILIYIILYGLTIAIMKAMLSETSPVENQMFFSRLVKIAATRYIPILR